MRPSGFDSCARFFAVNCEEEQDKNWVAERVNIRELPIGAIRELERANIRELEFDNLLELERVNIRELELENMRDPSVGPRRREGFSEELLRRAVPTSVNLNSPSRCVISALVKAIC